MPSHPPVLGLRRHGCRRTRRDRRPTTSHPPQVHLEQSGPPIQGAGSMSRPPTRMPMKRAASAPPGPRSAGPAIEVKAPRVVHWVEQGVLLAGTALVLGGFIIINSRSPLLLAGITTAAAASVAVIGIYGWRKNRRRQILARLTNLLIQLTKSDVVIERARWDGRIVG